RPLHERVTTARDTAGRDWTHGRDRCLRQPCPAPRAGPGEARRLAAGTAGHTQPRRAAQRGGVGGTDGARVPGPGTTRPEVVVSARAGPRRAGCPRCRGTTPPAR